MGITKTMDDTKKTVSFDLLVALILEFKKLPPQAVQNEKFSISATYDDEDGDEITISSSAELVEAFEQFTESKPPILRAKAIVVRIKKDGPTWKKVKEIKEDHITQIKEMRA